MSGFFSNIFRKKSGSVLGVDIGSSSIKIVQLARKNGRAILETYGELALGPYAEMEIGRATNLASEKISEALKDVIRESKVTTNSCGIAIPFNASLIATLEIPKVSEKELPQILPIEARKYIPVPISEVMLDWVVIPNANDTTLSPDQAEEDKAKPRREQLDVLLMAIHNDTLAKFDSIIGHASLEVSFFEIEIFSTIRAVVDQDVPIQMILDMGAATTKVYIVEHSIVRASHVINRGSQDVTLAIAESLGFPVQTAEVMKRDFTQIPDNRRADAEKIISLTLDYIFSEANKALLNYEKHYNKNVPRVVLIGGGARLGNIVKLAEAHFQTEVIAGHPFGKVESPAFLETVLRDASPEFAVAVGLALRKLQELG